MMLTLKKIESKIDYWQTVKRVWETEIKPTPDFNSFVFFTYLRSGSVAEVAQILNDMGYRKPGASGKEIRYISTDVSDIIRNADIKNKDLQKICREILDNNGKLADKFH